MSNEGEDKREQGGQGNGQGRVQAADGGGRDDEGGKVEPPRGEAAQPATAEDRLAALEAERDEIKDRMLRIAAEFENWKKRARKEQDEAESKARESVLRDMLDIMDNLERAMGAATGASTAKPGEKAKPGRDGGQGRGADRGAHRGAGGDGAGPDAQAVLKGVELVLRLFQTKLERYGIKSIAAVGQPFDPHLHEAISRIETGDVPAGHVAVEMQRGYRIGDRLLRPSLVGVAVPRGQTTGADGTGGGGGGDQKVGGSSESGNGVEKDGA